MELIDCPQCGMKHPPLLPGQKICPNAPRSGRKAEVIAKFIVHFQNLLESKITDENIDKIEKKLKAVLKVLNDKL